MHWQWLIDAVWRIFCLFRDMRARLRRIFYCKKVKETKESTCVPFEELPLTSWKVQEVSPLQVQYTDGAKEQNTHISLKVILSFIVLLYHCFMRPFTFFVPRWTYHCMFFHLPHSEGYIHIHCQFCMWHYRHSLVSKWAQSLQLHVRNKRIILNQKLSIASYINSFTLALFLSLIGNNAFYSSTTCLGSNLWMN